MGPVVTCVYDNPATMAREAFSQGKLLYAMQAELLLSKGFRGFRDMPFYMNVGPWSPGRVIGDRTAMPEGTEK